MNGGGLAVVTGAAGGIGRAVAARLAEDGFPLLLLDRAASVVDVANTHPDAVAEVVDIADHARVRALLVDVATSRVPSVLVNCAGTCTRTGFEDFSPQDWQRDIDSNLTSTFFLCQAVVFPHMRDRGSGRIVNVASVSGKVGGVGRIAADGGTRSGPAYAAAKAGVINLTRWIAREVGVWGITCNAVAPGPIATSMTEGAEDSYDFTGAAIRRFGRPTEVADAVSYLVDPGRGYTTGTCLHVDGGLVQA